MNDRDRRLSWILGVTALAILVAGATIVALERDPGPEGPEPGPRGMALVGGLSILAALGGVAVSLYASRQLYGSLEEQEEQIRSIVETAAEGIITTDDSGLVESFNTAAERMFGYRSAEVVGSSVTLLLPFSDSYGDTDDFMDFLRENHLAIGTTNVTRGMRKDGESFPMELSMSVANPRSRLIFMIICRDITERQQAQEALAKAQAHLEERVEARTAELRYANEALQKEIAERHRLEKARQKLLADLKETLAKLKVLGGLIPICANCKKVRDDQGYWKQIEAYVRDRSYADFSHGICPDCAKELYPDIVLGEKKDPETGPHGAGGPSDTSETRRPG